MEKPKQKKWIKPRHKWGRNLLKTFFLPHVKRKYGVKVEKFEGPNRPYLILLNHQTAYDQFLVGTAFDNIVYYVATEDIFSLGFLSKVINFFVAPIPIKKQTTDVRAVLNCKKIVKEGGTIAIMPEGNRTYSGQTEYINPAIAGLVKLLKLPVAFFRIEGGYGVHPRWSDVARKGGPMRAYVSRVMEAEEYADMDDVALNELIAKELYVDETQIEGEYPHKKLAEYLERVFYVCPQCGISEFVSKEDKITCKRCGKTARYLPSKKLQGVDCDFPFEYVKDWYQYQEKFVRGLDLKAFGENFVVMDEKVSLFDVILYKKKKRLTKKASITAYGDRLVLQYKKGTLVFAYDDLSAVTILGKNKLNVYYDGRVYQVKGDKRFNAVKYVHLYHHYKNVKEGKADGGFLGL